MAEPSNETQAKEQSEAATEEAARPEPAKKKVDPVRRLTRIVLAVIAVIFVWYLFADRHTPYTAQARVQDFVVPLVPQVSGYVLEAIDDVNRIVEEGEVLVQIDPTPYELTVAASEARLERARQNLQAGTTGLFTAEARVREARAQRRQAQVDFDRVESIYAADPGATSEASRTQARTRLEAAEEQVQAAEAELQRASELLAIQDDITPEIRAAEAELDQANRKVKYSTIRAPARGAIVNMRIEEGMFASAGSSLGSFLPFERVWIEANFRENSLGNVQPGDPVEILLDFAPGKVFDGRVVSIGYAVQPGAGSTMRGTLANPRASGGWLRRAQYFPVEIEFDDVEAAQPYRIVGGQADVIIYTGDNVILNAIGASLIRVMTFLSYVY